MTAAMDLSALDLGEMDFFGEVGSIHSADDDDASQPPSTRRRATVLFPKPTTGHICPRCAAIPAEILLAASSFFSDRCKARRHFEAANCKGKHDITCFHCRVEISEQHWHCGVCEDDDLDVCKMCWVEGKRCLSGEEHELGKRIFDGKMVREVEVDDDTYVHPGLRQRMLEAGLEPYRLHESLAELIASAEEGCHSCSVLVGQMGDAIEGVERDTPVFVENRPLVVPMDWRFVNHMQKMMLVEPDLDSVEADEGKVFTVVAVRTERDAENPVFEDPTKDRVVCFLPFELRAKSRTYYSRYLDWMPGCKRRQIAPVVDAGDNLKVVKSWLKECRDGDSECASWPKDGFRPTRLIAIETSATGAPSMRLVNSKDITEQFSGYVTLSYCWGPAMGEMPWRLTKQRLPDFETAIPSAVLPKTIADAVRITFENDIHYLWVDSLCIVQDDADDWTYEAYRMAQVYNGSLFTMISGSDSSTGGLLTAREQLKVSAAEVPIKPPSNPTPESVVDLAVLYPRLGESRTRHRCGPTSKRAWCYQEELLSVRRLYFSDGAFNWECLCTKHSEAGIKGPGDVSSSSYIIPEYDAEVVLKDQRVVGQWRGIVKEYSSREITYHGDVFAALAGIASSLKTRYESRYLAGLWECTILDELLWHRVGTSLDRPEDFEAPSWSWLSVKGAVIFGRGDKAGTETDAEYIGCDIQTMTGDEFGAVAPGGTLRLRARLLECEVCPSGQEEDNEKLTNAYQPMPSEERAVGRGNHDEDEDTDQEDDTDQDKETNKDEETDKIEVTDKDEVTNKDKVTNKDEGADQNERAESDADADADSEADSSPYIMRTAPWESSGPDLIAPPGGRPDMAARLKIRNGDNALEFATVLFDGEAEAQTTSLSVAYISATTRPGGVIDRNGIAVVPVKKGEEGGGRKVYRRVGFVAFWDKMIKDDLGFLLEKEKTDIELV